MRLGGWPTQLVCTMTCTSEISGSASKGMFRNDQIPASTSRRVATKTRKRFSAHQSIQRVITLHPSRGVEAELFRGDRLAILFRDDSDLPRSAAVELAGALVDSIPFFGERDGSTHRSHAHCRHSGHEEGDRHLRTRDGGAIRAGKFHANEVAASPRRSRIGRKFGRRLWRVRRACAPGSWRRRHEGAERRLELAFRIDQEVRGSNDLFALLQAFQDDEAVAASGAKFNLARFEIAVAAIHENHLPGPGLQNPARGNHKLLSLRGFESDVHVHSGCEFETRIWESNASAHGARCHLHLRVEKVHAALKGPAGVGVHRKLRTVAYLDPSQVVLKHFGEYPHRG